MKLKAGTIYKDKQGIHWLYTGLGGSGGFTCSICERNRLHTHEFLGYKRLNDLKSDIQSQNIHSFNYNEHFGTECIKEFVKTLIVLAH